MLGKELKHKVLGTITMQHQYFLWSELINSRFQRDLLTNK